MNKFKIQSYKSKRYFWVYIHSSLEELKREAKKYHKLTGSRYRWTGEWALFHPFEKWRIKDGKEKKLNNIGIIRLVADKLHPRCIYHEIIHAALWQYRLRHRKKADFGKEIDRREEEFAHIYNQLLSKTINKLYKTGLWSELR